MPDFTNVHAGYTALVLGNGKSRLHIDPDQVATDAWIFGCNAAFRDVPCDYVFSVDDGPCEEWAEIGPKLNSLGGEIIYVTAADHPHHTTQSGVPIHVWRPLGRKGALSGTLAATFAVHTGVKIVVLCGFDQDGLNVYTGTRCYGAKPGIRAEHNQQARMIQWVTSIKAREGHDPIILQLVDHDLGMRHTIPWAEPVGVPPWWLKNETTR